MSPHDFCAITQFCLRCGLSRAMLEVAAIPCPSKARRWSPLDSSLYSLREVRRLRLLDIWGEPA